MKLRTFSILLSLVVAMPLSALATADDSQPVLLQYLVQTSDSEPLHVAPGFEATPLMAHQMNPLVTGFSKPNRNAYFLLNNSANQAPLLPQTREDALEGDSFFEFTVTPQGNLPFHLSELTLRVGHESSRTLAVYLVLVAETGDETYVEDVRFGSLSYYEAVNANSNAAELPASAKVVFKELPNTLSQPVTFRIYAYYELLKGEEILSGYTDSIRIGDISLIGKATD